jgi:hypothetical protein
MPIHPAAFEQRHVSTGDMKADKVAELYSVSLDLIWTFRKRNHKWHFNIHAILITAL